MRLRVGSGWSDLEIRFTSYEVMMNRFAGDVLELLQGLVWLAVMLVFAAFVAVVILLFAGMPLWVVLAVIYGLELLM